MATNHFKEGERAYRDGLSLDSNPYPFGSSNQKDWQAGWCNAWAEDVMQTGARGSMDE